MSDPARRAALACVLAVEVDGAYANLESVEDVFSVGINRAVSVLAEKVAKGPGRRGSTPVALKDLGEHPNGGGNVTVRDGKYGAYVNFGTVNATIPKGKDPAAITMDEALALIAAREAAGGGKKSSARKSTGKTASAAKAAPKKKSAAKPAKKKAAT